MESYNEFRSSGGAFEEFLQSTIWQDIMQEIDTWERRVLEELAEPTFDMNTGKMVMAKDERVLYDEMLRGSRQAFDRFRELPNVILQIIKDREHEHELNEGKQDE